MEAEDKSYDSEFQSVESKEGERRLLSSNKATGRSPFLEYTFIPNPEKLNKAFDVLFDEVLRDSKNPWNPKK
jgi:hypothetical protein